MHRRFSKGYAPFMGRKSGKASKVWLAIDNAVSMAPFKNHRWSSIDRIGITEPRLPIPGDERTGLESKEVLVCSLLHLDPGEPSSFLDRLPQYPGRKLPPDRWTSILLHLRRPLSMDAALPGSTLDGSQVPV